MENSRRHKLKPPATSLAYLSSLRSTHSSIVQDWRNSLETHQKIHMILSFSPAFSQPTCCGSPPNSPLRLCTRQGRLYPDKYICRFWNHSFCLPVNTHMQASIRLQCLWGESAAGTIGTFTVGFASEWTSKQTLYMVHYVEKSYRLLTQ